MKIDLGRYSSGAQFLKAGDVRNKGKYVVESAEEMELTRDGEKAPVVVLHFRGVEQPMSLNVTNLKRMVELWGDDTKRWRGKTIVLIHTMANNPKDGNKPVKSLRIQ